MHSMIPDGEIPTNKPINSPIDFNCSQSTCGTMLISIDEYNKLKKEHDELKKKCEEFERQFDDLNLFINMKDERINYLEAIIRTVEVLTGGKILKE